MRVNDSGYLECYLEYIDYDGEDLDWVAVFQENPASSSQNSKGSTEVMIRPSFPQWYYGHEPDQLPVSDVTAVVDEAWKVGDMVDWLKDGCYWSGTITKLLKKDMVKANQKSWYTARLLRQYKSDSDKSTSGDENDDDEKGGMQQ